jgi:hypothetical protein
MKLSITVITKSENNQLYLWRLSILLFPVVSCAAFDSALNGEEYENSDCNCNIDTGLGVVTTINTGNECETDDKNNRKLETETEIEFESDSGTDLLTTTGTDTIFHLDGDADTDADTDTDGDVDSDSAVHTALDTDTDTKTDTGSGVGTDTGSDTDSGPRTDTATASDQRSDVDTETDTGVRIGTYYDMRVMILHQDVGDEINEWYRMFLQIHNDDWLNVELKELMLRYYYKLGEGSVPQSFYCWAGGCRDVAANFYYINAPNADYYVELRFDNSTKVIGTDKYWGIYFGLHVESNYYPIAYTFDNDWSYSNKTVMADAPYITLYTDDGETLIWGHEP